MVGLNAFKTKKKEVIVDNLKNIINDDMQIVKINIKDIKPYEHNAKKHPKEQVKNIAQSLKDFGWKQPIVVDTNNVIIIGHGRWQASKLLKLKTAPCVIADIPEEDAKRLRILDNKLNESEWDTELLKLDMQDLNFDDYDLTFDLGLEIEEEIEPTITNLVEKKLLKCPCCGHVNEEKAFKNYEDTE